MGRNIKSIITLLIASFVLINVGGGCSPKATKYYFVCNEQSPDIIATYIPQVFFSLGYEAKSFDSIPNYYEGTKKILVTNLKKGIKTESIQIRVNFNFDSIQSEITQYNIIDFNGKRTVKALDKELQLKYVADVKQFQEKMLFYCNSKFKGRS